MTPGPQVRHLVAYRDPTEGTLIYTGFPKSVKNGAKRGYPLTRKLTVSPTKGCVLARRALEGRFVAPFRPPDGPQKRLLGVYSRVDPLAR